MSTPPLPSVKEVYAYAEGLSVNTVGGIDRVTYKRLAKELHESAKAAVLSARPAVGAGSVDSLTPGLHVVDAGDHYLVIEVRTAAKESPDHA